MILRFVNAAPKNKHENRMSFFHNTNANLTSFSNIFVLKAKRQIQKSPISIGGEMNALFTFGGSPLLITKNAYKKSSYLVK